MNSMIKTGLIVLVALVIYDLVIAKMIPGSDEYEYEEED